MNQSSKLIAAIAFLTVLIFGGLVYALFRLPPGAGLPGGEARFDDGGAIQRGKADAAVVVRMYSDFQCPACRATEPPLRAIVAQYADRVKFVWKDFPLLLVHPNARAAANAGRCANAQSKFWEYHDRLFDAQEAWSGAKDPEERFIQFAREAGLDEGEFAACYRDRRFDAAVMANVSEGEANGVNSTPTFYLNDKPTSARSEVQWRAVLDAALAEAASAAASSTAPAAR